MEQTFLQTEKLNTLKDFYKSPNNGICFLEGKTGFFKSALVNESLKNIDEDILVFKIKCFESTTLDDIFLSLFEDLKKYSHQKKVSFSKIETNSISQRINKYLSSITARTVIIIDTFQNILNDKKPSNNEEKEEILRFISHLNAMNKFKIVLVSTFFPANISQMLESNSYTHIVKINMEPLSKEQTTKYFETENIQTSQETIDEFYKLSNGNPAYLYIASNIINTLSTTLENLIEEYKSKKLSFEDYLLQKLITFVTDKVKKSLYTLSLFNGGLSEDFLIKNDFFTKEQISYMIEKGIIVNECGLIYLKSYLKKYLQKSITNYEKIRIHTLWRDFYTALLPLKPGERPVLISRNTMRAQIEYHGSFIINQRKQDKTPQEMSLMSYLNSNITAWNIKNTNAEKQEENHPEKQRPTPPKSLQNRLKRKNGLEKYELTKNEIALLSVPVDLRKQKEDIEREKLSRTMEQQEEEKKSQVKSIKEILITAENLLEQHNFEAAASLYLNALEQKTDTDYEEVLPKILENLAFCCKKMNKTAEAIDFYNKLSDLYSQKNQTDKMNDVKLEIAQIYKETYKISHARLIYENFINKKTPASEKIILNSYIELAEIEEDLSNIEKAIEYYKKAFQISPDFEQDDTISELIAEAYFKYALILDDYNNTQSALNYYQKCINLSKKPSVYVSSSYTNLGEIMKETNNITKAIEYYKKGLKTDLEQSNYEGIYYICLKLARAYEDSAPDNVLNWLLKSLSAAKRTKENLYITNAYLEVGDYYYKKTENEKALKAFLLAQKYFEKQDNQENQQVNKTQIENRINDAKAKLPQQTFDNIYREVNKDE